MNVLVFINYWLLIGFCITISSKFPSLILKFAKEQWTSELTIISKIVYVRYSNPCTALDRPSLFQKVEAPRFQDSRHIKVVRSSTLRTGNLYPPENILGTHFWLRLESTPGPQWSRKDYVNENFQCLHRESNPRPSGLYSQYLNQLYHRVSPNLLRIT